MADDESLHIFPQIRSLISDKLQVVSYKWLSRNFLVSSNNAKRLLQLFVDKFGNEFEVIYVLSGWSDSKPKTYSVKLATSLKLAEVKKEFVDGCSIQIYSVQACIPDDLTVIWNTEFIQAEGLFNQPLTEENCLRDNRFCGVANSFVKRDIKGKHARIAPPREIDRVTKVTVASKTNGDIKETMVHSPHQPSQDQLVSNPKEDKSSELKVGTKVKVEETVETTVKLPVAKENTSTLKTSKEKAKKNEKASTGNTGSLANLWGRASTKPKARTDTVPVLAVPVSAEAQICAQEAADDASSEEEDLGISVKRESSGPNNRKRRVILESDDEDDDHGADGEDENVVSLASPVPSREKDAMAPVTNSLISEENNIGVAEDKGGVKVLQDDTKSGNSAVSPKVDIESRSTKISAKDTLKEKIPSSIQDDSSNDKKNQTSNGASTSPKRRKVLRTHIDDRGREVTEVVWEGEAADGDEVEKKDAKKDALDRAPLANKAQTAGSNAAANPGSKVVNNKKPTKGGPKDVKQGSLLSFFKKA